MIFHENCLLADDSHIISCLIFFQKLGKMSQNLMSATVVIGTLKVNIHTIACNSKPTCIVLYAFLLSADYFQKKTNPSGIQLEYQIIWIQIMPDIMTWVQKFQA